jgi:hypothetical protein
VCTILLQKYINIIYKTTNAIKSTWIACLLDCRKFVLNFRFFEPHPDSQKHQRELYFTLYQDAHCLLSIVWYQQSWENGLLTVLSKHYFKLYQDAHCLLSIVWYEQSSENGLLTVLSSAHAAWWADAVKDEPSPASGHPVLLDQPRYPHKQIGYLFKGTVQRDGSG